MEEPVEMELMDTCASVCQAILEINVKQKSMNAPVIRASMEERVLI